MNKKKRYKKNDIFKRWRKRYQSQDESDSSLNKKNNKSYSSKDSKEGLNLNQIQLKIKGQAKK